MEEKGWSKYGGNIARADINGPLRKFCQPAGVWSDKYRRWPRPPGVSASRASAMPGFTRRRTISDVTSPSIHYCASYPVDHCRVGTGDISEPKAFSRWRKVVVPRLTVPLSAASPWGKLCWFTGHVRWIQRGYQRYDNTRPTNGNHNNLTVGVDYQLNEQVIRWEG